MILKQQLINNIEQLSTDNLIIVQNFVQMLMKPTKQQRLKNGYLKTREALVTCQDNLAKDINNGREEVNTLC